MCQHVSKSEHHANPMVGCFWNLLAQRLCIRRSELLWGSCPRYHTLLGYVYAVACSHSMHVLTVQESGGTLRFSKRFVFPNTDLWRILGLARKLVSEGDSENALPSPLPSKYCRSQTCCTEGPLSPSTPLTVVSLCLQ